VIFEHDGAHSAPLSPDRARIDPRPIFLGNAIGIGVRVHIDRNRSGFCAFADNEKNQKHRPLAVTSWMYLSLSKLRWSLGVGP